MKKATVFRVAAELSLLIAVLSAIGYAAVSWNGTRSYTLANQSITVDRPLNLDYGIVQAGTTTENFVVTNNGNTPLTVTASATATGATASWDKTSATINAGSSQTFVLTLTITASGSCQISFNASPGE